MSGAACLTGVPWHTVYVTINPKKEKAADCIYLDSDRICNCKECSKYLSHCFIASCCKHRIKEKDAKTKRAKAVQKTVKKETILPTYTLPIGTPVFTMKGKPLRILGYELEQERIVIGSFDSDETVKYKYPKAFIDGYLTTEMNEMLKIKEVYKYYG